MNESTAPVVQRELTLRNRRGLHARAAARFAATAEQFESEIEVEFNDRRVNGKSIMGLMMLAAACGKTITVTATGDDAAQAIEGIAELVDARFHESE
ncbi:HPr family phosphocarrier protein [Guyparkeria sp. SCN-R1]|uniref:HPr family phosphocarrier protein n=1 Tax=unclassified Guyparkeria TaxID=2626246 RepID=UPI000F64596A|nr:HPr family phosphocarrier protein [Guyparkeria sp. SCN-R1]RRQ23671.1 HPr family phosphocarrier protein [Guyparkeria sp. SCN-R1]